MLTLTYIRSNVVVQEFKKRLLKAFYELAQQRRPAVRENLSILEILQIAMEAKEKRLKLEAEKQQLKHQAEANAPRAHFAKRVEIAPDAITAAKAAKLIGAGQIGWVTRVNEPYQAKIEAGLPDDNLGEWKHQEHGLQQAATTLATSKGLLKLPPLARRAAL